MLFPRTLLLIMAASLGFAAFAQADSTDTPRHGCHFHRQQEHRLRGPITPEEALMIQETIARSDTFDIVHYEIAIDVTDYAGQTISAATTVTFRALMEGLTSIRFDLFELDVDSVIFEGQQLAFDYDGAFLQIYFAGALEMDFDHDVTVHYGGSPHRDDSWGGFYFQQNYIYNLGIGITTIPPNFGKVWYPCFDSFVEKATYSYHVKSAGTFRAHCQGEFLGEFPLEGDTVVRSYALYQPIPTYVSAIAVADYLVHEDVHEGAYGEIPIRLIGKANDLPGMVNRFGNLGSAIDACEFWYGPYAWGRVGYVLTTAGALEIPTNVAYPAFMTGQSDLANQDLYTHELGHQWWGVMVSPRTHNDMWLKEGPAEYSTHLIREWMGGPTDMGEALRSNQYHVLRNAHVNDDGFQALSPMPDEHIYGTHTYYKGAAVMHNLRAYMGDSLFRQAMHAIQEDFAYSELDAAGFREALENVSGLDLEAYFDAHILAPGFAAFVVHSMDATPNGDGWDVEVVVRQGLRGTDVHHQEVPLTLSLIDADRNSTDHDIVVGGEFTTVTLQTDLLPAIAVLDRHTKLNMGRIDFERTLPPGGTLPLVLPNVDFRVYGPTFTDTTLVRVEHIWAGPDQDDIGWGIEEISDTHYWIVDGIWPEGTAMDARVYYEGALETRLDHALYGTSEEDALLVYRPSPQHPWEVFPDFTLMAGNLFDGNGHFRIHGLQRGHYAFAKGAFVASTNEVGADVSDLQLFPVPATDQLTIRGVAHWPGQVQLDILDAEGRMVMRSYSFARGATDERLNIAGLASGNYVLRAKASDGRILGVGRFMVVD